MFLSKLKIKMIKYFYPNLHVNSKILLNEQQKINDLKNNC